MEQFFEKMRMLTHDAVDRTYEIFKKTIGILADDVKPERFEYVPDQNVYRFDIKGLEARLKLDLNLFDMDIRVFANERTPVAECVLDIEGRFNEQYNRIPDKDANTAVHDFFRRISEIEVAPADNKTTDDNETEVEVVEDPNNE